MNANHILVERLAAALTARKARITLAESCTGGWIAKNLTDFPGSSGWFEYGFVSYGDNAKQDLLGVDAALLETHGAVSSEVALAMGRGAMERAGADFAIAVTGIAGPDGGTPEKPVGTVWIAWLWRDAEPVVECHHFDGDRDMVRRVTVSTALQQALTYLEQVGG